MKQHLDNIRPLGHIKLKESGHYKKMLAKRWAGHMKAKKVEA